MTHQDLCTLVDFHYWARDRMLDAVDGLTSDQYARDLGRTKSRETTTELVPR